MTFKDTLRQRGQKDQAVKALKKLNVYDILIKPINLTEKAYKLTQELNKYVFQVHKEANKNDVKVAIKSIYGVDAEKVNIVSVISKGRSVRKLVRRAYKKAIVTLKA